jgi:PAS domain S-box-containing protein/putative nucleotidyltransferase with HDIG domain
MKVDKRKKNLNSSELVNAATISGPETAISGGEAALDAHQKLPVNQTESETQKSEFNHLREELQEYRNKYSVLFDLAPISYLTIDDKGIILEANLSLANLLGVQKQNLIGLELIKFVDTISKKTFQAQLNTSLSTGVRQSCQLNMRNSSGSTFATNMESIPIRDPKGYLSQCRLTITDVVETNNSFLANKAGKPGSDAVVTTDYSLNITSWSKAAEEMFGWKIDEVIGIPDSSRICTKILEVLTQEQVMQNLRDNDFWSGESTCYKKDGSKFQVFTSISVIWNKEGSFNGIVAVFHPIDPSKSVDENKLEHENEIEEIVKERTEELAKANRILQQELRIHKQAALLAKESEGKNRDLVDNIKLGIFRRTPGIKGKFLEVNKAMEDITGFSRRELLETNLSDLYIDLTEVDTFTNEASISDWKEIRELNLKKRDGNIITIVETVVAIRYDSGKIVFWDGILEDITERKQAQLQIQQSLQRLQKTIKEIIQAMAYIGEVRDPYTAGHQKRVAQISFELARIMGIPDDQYEGLTMAAFVHDIGKILVPADILSKPGKLTKPEFDMLKDHTRIGYEILKTIEFPWPIANIVLQHHERLNGSGYPAGLSGDQIILEAKILAVADVVEAMSSHRPYRPALGIDKALAEINQNKGTLYDPTVVDACDKLFIENGFHLN